MNGIRTMRVEFFNDHLLHFWKEKVVGVQLSRSRPYQKNDNPMVEQKNETLIRQYLGYDRLDTPSQLEAVNALYERMWIYYNLFQPVLHLIKKEVIDGKVKRSWDEAQTPYARLLATGAIGPEQQERLQQLYLQTNPLALRQEIYERLTALWEQQLSPQDTAA